MSGNPTRSSLQPLTPELAQKILDRKEPAIVYIMTENGLVRDAMWTAGPNGIAVDGIIGNIPYNKVFVSILTNA